MKRIDFRSLVLVMIVAASHVPAFAQATPALPSPLSLIDVSGLRVSGGPRSKPLVPGPVLPRHGPRSCLPLPTR